MEECGFWGALCEVLPAFETVNYVERASTSSGLRNRETGESYLGSGGCHVVIPVDDAGDIPRFLSDFHDRCWLAGLGWGMASAAGSFLKRAIIDPCVGSPERLIFEGAPIIEPPLEQTNRNAKAYDEGFVLDTRLCPSLTDEERVRVRELQAAEELRLLPERQAARAKWSPKHIARLTKAGMPEAEARQTVDHWIDRKELSGNFPLPFDELMISGTTVADVLAAPSRYIGKTLSDPYEGPDYGRGKAILYQRNNGSLFINSFAHGGATYELRVLSDPQRKPGLELRYGHAAALPQPMGTIVKGILHAGSLTLFYGPPKSGKSFTDLFRKITDPEEDDWMGQAIVRHGAVLYVACEGHTGFWKRLRAVELDRNIILPDDFVLAVGRPQLIQIDPKSHVAVPHPDDVIDAVNRATAAGHAPIAVAIDTVFRSVGAGNVSASDHMNAYLAALAAVTDKGIALAAVHHETKAGGTPAGSVTLIAGADTLINTQKLAGGSHCWNVAMAKDDCETETRAFSLDVIDVGHDSEGQPQASCVVRDGEKLASVDIKRAKLKPEHAEFRKILMDAIAEAGTLNIPLPGMPSVWGISRKSVLWFIKKLPP